MLKSDGWVFRPGKPDELTVQVLLPSWLPTRLVARITDMAFALSRVPAFEVPIRVAVLPRQTKDMRRQAAKHPCHNVFCDGQWTTWTDKKTGKLIAYHLDIAPEPPPGKVEPWKSRQYLCSLLSTLVHELKHCSDHAVGLKRGRTSRHGNVYEIRAFEVQTNAGFTIARNKAWLTTFHKLSAQLNRALKGRLPI